MSTVHTLARTVFGTLTAIALLAFANPVMSGNSSHTVDDFSDPQHNSLGIDRMFVDDTTVGGKTSAHYSVEDGILVVKGKIAPPRGQPGWASAILLLDPRGLPVNASEFEGIRLRVRVIKGNLSVSANSSEVTNYDYHAAAISRQADGLFHDVRIPFAGMVVRQAQFAVPALHNPPELIAHLRSWHFASASGRRLF